MEAMHTPAAHHRPTVDECYFHEP